MPISSLKEPYFANNDCWLYLGDCLELLRLVPDNKFDMIFADPPYFLSTGTFTCQNGKAVSVKKGDWDLGGSVKDNYEFHKQWLSECKRILKPSGTLWVSGTYHSIFQCAMAISEVGYHVLNDIIWFKPNASPNLSCRFFTASHETLIWARKDKKSKHKFNYDVMKNANWSGDFIKKPNMQMRSVWSINPPRKEEKEFGKHPTQKPVDLLKRIIMASTDEHDLILDPFTGSSTTGVVARTLRRKFVGFDIEREYLDLSIKRLESVK
ncbi:MAG: site-specific DNA-methyltransferase [Sphingobacteriaceae bacterium]|nr:site-specific DNA-methyltransferase [Sphingobacteriaceae bacterium]